MSVRRFCETQPESFAFTPENLAWAKKEMTKYPQGRQASAILALFWRAQEQAGGWLPRPAVEHVAGLLGVSKIRAYEIVTFYTMFNLAPVGKHHVQVCTTTPCWLRGSDAVLAACKQFMGTKEGEVSGDGLFSFVEVECLGACVNAPVVQIGKDYYEDLDGERMETILRTLKDGRAPRLGPQIHRHGSAPVGEQTTLTDPALYAKAGE